MLRELLLMKPVMCLFKFGEGAADAGTRLLR